jgi:hypothetical protein
MRRTIRTLQLAIMVTVLLSAVFAVSAQDDTPRREIYTVLAYGDEVFEPDVWLVSAASEQASRTTVQWTADSMQAVAYVDYLHFDDGATAKAIAEYFDDEGWAVILSNYEDSERTALCTSDDLKLYEYAVTFEGDPYLMRYWIEQVSDTRVAAANLVFREDDIEIMDEYAARFFPDLISCDTAQ